MLKKLWKWSNLTFSLLYWLGKNFLYSWWVEKKIFSTPDENSQIFWLGSGIFHLVVPLLHFHLQYRNENFPLERISAHCGVFAKFKGVHNYFVWNLFSLFFIVWEMATLITVLDLRFFPLETNLIYLAVLCYSICFT